MSTIIHKKSSVAAKVPLAGDLQYGELAINYEDEKLYFKNSAGQVKSWSRNNDVYAKATEAILKGQLVMFAGAQGDHILVSKANLNAVGFIDTWIVGVANQNFAINDFGDVTWFGNIEGIDTSAWPEGTVLYASTTVGGLTSTKPTQPNHIIQIAAVTRSHANEGSLIVRPTFGMHLGDLHDVYVPSPANGNTIVYNSTTNRFESTALKTVNGNSLIGSGNITVSAESPLSIGDNPPTTPATKPLWWDSAGGNLYVYYTDTDGSQWVPATPIANPQALLSDSTTSINTTWSSSKINTAKQDTLVSGTNIRTVNGNSLLGSGNIAIDVGVTTFNTRTGAITLTSSDVTSALGFTPYNSTNPSGYITSSASITGSAATLTTARTLTIGNTGKTFNGSSDVSWSLAEIGAGDVTTAGTQTLTNKTISGATYSGVVDVSGSARSSIVAVAALNVDCSLGNFFTKTINANSTFTFSNAPASRAYSFVLELTHTSGTVTWPAAVRWPGTTAPTLTSGRTHLFVFVTDDGGTTWRGASSVDYSN